MHLYDTDYDIWLIQQIESLQKGNLKELDIPHLIEELEALVRGEKSAVESFTYQIMLHLLLIDYWHEEYELNWRHWRAEVNNFQFQLSNRLSTSLKNYLNSRLNFIYNKAKKTAVVKTGLPNRFPEKNPYDLSQILGDDLS